MLEQMVRRASLQANSPHVIATINIEVTVSVNLTDNSPTPKQSSTCERKCYSTKQLTTLMTPIGLLTWQLM